MKMGPEYVRGVMFAMRVMTREQEPMLHGTSYSRLVAEATKQLGLADAQQVMSDADKFFASGVTQ